MPGISRAEARADGKQPVHHVSDRDDNERAAVVCHGGDSDGQWPARWRSGDDFRRNARCLRRAVAVSTIVNSTTFRYIPAAGLAAASGTITAATNDQFNFAYEPFNGNAVVSAQLLGLTNADEGNGTPMAGVMVRGSTNDNDPFVAMVQTTVGGLVFEYRTTTGGNVNSVSLGGLSVGSEYVEIVRSGNNFGGYYSSNGTAWTQLGATVAIAAMPSTANVGLAATANYNPQLTDATFANVNVGVQAPPSPPPPLRIPIRSPERPPPSASSAPKTAAIPASPTPGPTPVPSGVTYSGNTNGTNAAKNITAIFTQAGNYNFTATITDPGATIPRPAGLGRGGSADADQCRRLAGHLARGAGGDSPSNSRRRRPINSAMPSASPSFSWGITGRRQFDRWHGERDARHDAGIVHRHRHRRRRPGNGDRDRRELRRTFRFNPGHQPRQHRRGLAQRPRQQHHRLAKRRADHVHRRSPASPSRTPLQTTC